MRRLIKLGVVIAVSLLAAACASNSNSGGGSTAGPTGVLTIDNESGGNWTCDFNPFNLSDISFSLGTVYEPLIFVNTLQNNKTKPWLATTGIFIAYKFTFFRGFKCKYCCYCCCWCLDIAIPFAC